MYILRRMKRGFKHLTLKAEQASALLSYFIKWLVICLIAGALIGSASALLLVSLDMATDYRESHLWIIAGLPVAGLLIGLMYHHWGSDVTKGNNELIEEIHTPKKGIIPFRMAPLIYVGTVITHLFGGSAGREGTAVQMGGAIADRLARLFKLHPQDRRTMLIVGISAGFASVFGTPLAGAVFALEVVIVGRVRYESILPSLLAAVFAHVSCHLWGVAHTDYSIPFVPELTITHILLTILAGILFGLTARFFSRSGEYWSELAKKTVKYPPLRPFIGGAIVAIAVWGLGTTKYIGLGLPTIVESFTVQQAWYDFAAKILFTTFTIGVGFKGGEVTPLFFVGATLGSALFGIIPLPMALLAGMGFVGVFAGATNTPIACTLMGIELFGAESGVYIGIACVVSFLLSGRTGIYGAQIMPSFKHEAIKRGDEDPPMKRD